MPQQLPYYLRREVLGRNEPFTLTLQNAVQPLLEVTLANLVLIAERRVPPLCYPRSLGEHEKVRRVYFVVEHFPVELQQLAT